MDLEFLNEHHYAVSKERIKMEEGIPVPLVGDSVIIGGRRYKIVERTFVYQGIKQNLSGIIFICKDLDRKMEL